MEQFIGLTLAVMTFVLGMAILSHHMAGGGWIRTSNLQSILGHKLVHTPRVQDQAD